MTQKHTSHTYTHTHMHKPFNGRNFLTPSFLEVSQMFHKNSSLSFYFLPEVSEIFHRKFLSFFSPLHSAAKSICSCMNPIYSFASLPLYKFR
mmetsp:Transcript_31442/g.50503  ORF Transcript_31442/g.50503 Transcript_31442/m.50503 type:complete len:92 (+) Transcript_31442:1600-1875(+)